MLRGLRVASGFGCSEASFPARASSADPAGPFVEPGRPASWEALHSETAERQNPRKEKHFEHTVSQGIGRRRCTAWVGESRDRNVDHAIGAKLAKGPYANSALRGADILSASEGDILVPWQEPSHPLIGFRSESLACHPFVIASYQKMSTDAEQKQ